MMFSLPDIITIYADADADIRHRQADRESRHATFK